MITGHQQLHGAAQHVGHGDGAATGVGAGVGAAGGGGGAVCRKQTQLRAAADAEAAVTAELRHRGGQRQGGSVVAQLKRPEVVDQPQ